MERPALFLRRLGLFVLLPIGFLLLLAAAWTVWSTNAWLKRSVEVQGTVIEVLRVRDSDNTGYLFTPRVRFQTTDGREIEFQSGLRTNPPAYRTGQTVQVFYDPGEPRSAVIRGLFSIWFMPIILSFIGLIFGVIGTAMVVMSRHADRALNQPAAT